MQLNAMTTKELLHYAEGLATTELEKELLKQLDSVLNGLHELRSEYPNLAITLDEFGLLDY